MGGKKLKMTSNENNEKINRLKNDFNTLRGEMELEDLIEQREYELALKMAQEKYEEELEEICETCSWLYNDGFCTYNLTYPDRHGHCNHWTNEELELDYDFLYRRCKDYIEICEMYKETERLKKKYPEKLWEFSLHNEDFFLQCCLNDLKRELTKWKLKK